MTQDRISRGQIAGATLAFVLIVSCFLGYGVGADKAQRDNARDAAAAAP
ncbi:hypothetical protein [Novosphingobium gossypii]